MKTRTFSRRKFMQFSAGGLGVALAAACVPAAPAAQDSDTGAAADEPMEEVMLSFWSEGAADWAEEQIEKYQEMMPNVSIEFVTFKWGEMTPKLMTASAGGAAPHITRQDRFRMAGWAGRGGATLLDDFVDQYNINGDDYFPATWAEGVWAGKVYSIPFNTDGRFIIWNKDIFAEEGLEADEPPPTQDWEAMIDLAAQLTKTTDDGAVEVMGFVPSQMLGYGNGGDYVYAWANGAEFMKDDRTAWLDNPKLVETMQWQYDCVNAVGGIDKASEFSSGWPTVAGFNPFGTGRLAMMVSGDWNLSTFARYYEDLNFGLAPWRLRGMMDQYTGFAGGFCLAIPAGAENLDESFELLNFLAGLESQIAHTLRYQNIPCLIEAALDEDVINSSPFPELRRLANESMNYANFRPITPVGQEIQDLWTYPGTGRDWVFYGQKTPEEACADMQEIVQKALDDFWASV